MALKKTGTKAPASRSLDYSLSADILNRVKAAEDNTKLMNTAGMIGQVGASIGGAAKTIIKTREEQSEQEKLEQDKLNEEKGKWEECWQKVDNRGSWATPEVYDQFAELEKDYQTEYNNAIEAGNNQEAAKLLKQQENRSAQLQQWKGVVEGSKDTWSQDLWAENMPTEDMEIINAINSQENAQIAYTDPDEEKGTPGGDMIFRITLSNGQTKDVTLADYNKIAQRNIKPVAVQNEWGKSMEKINEQAAKQETFNFEPGSQLYNQQLSANRQLVTRDNFQSMISNNFIGGESTFEQDILKHEDFNNVKLADLKITDKTSEDGKFATQFDKNNDGILGKEEVGEIDFVSFSDKDKRSIVNLMKKEENFEVAKHYLGDYMTRMLYQNSKTTRKEYETERTNSNKYSKHN
tara:strand:- start:550 stop:1770 length:1221 start_codon:yes stop_codon:yes gene_type:complete